MLAEHEYTAGSPAMNALPAAPTSGRRPHVLAILSRLVAGAVVMWAFFVGIGELIVHVWAHSRFGRADAEVDGYLAAHRTSAGKSVSLALVYLADTKTVIVLTVLVVIGVYLARRRVREPLFLIAVVVGEVTTFVAVTAVVARQRPTVPRLDASPPTSSFPSGHTAAATCLYGGIAILCAVLVRRVLLLVLTWTAAIVIPILVAAARLYRGMHFPTDVIGGALLGVLWLLWVTRVYPLHEAGRSPRRRGHSSGCR